MPISDAVVRAAQPVIYGPLCQLPSFVGEAFVFGDHLSKLPTFLNAVLFCFRFLNGVLRFLFDFFRECLRAHEFIYFPYKSPRCGFMLSFLVPRGPLLPFSRRPRTNFASIKQLASETNLL